MARFSSAARLVRALTDALSEPARPAGPATAGAAGGGAGVGGNITYGDSFELGDYYHHSGRGDEEHSIDHQQLLPLPPIAPQPAACITIPLLPADYERPNPDTILRHRRQLASVDSTISTSSSSSSSSFPPASSSSFPTPRTSSPALSARRTLSRTSSWASDVSCSSDASASSQEGQQYHDRPATGQRRCRPRKREAEVVWRQYWD